MRTAFSSPSFSQFCVTIACIAAASLSAGCSDDGGGGGGGTTTQDAGATDGGTDTGSSSGADSGSSSGGAKDTGSSSGAVDAGSSGGSSSGATDTGSSSGTTTPGKHNALGTALPITVGAEATAEKLAPVGESDYFTFEGKKGDAMLIGVSAQQTAFDKNALDTVITLYDADQKQIAENDDPLPRFTNDSQIFTILPKDGTYYVVVTECWTWVESKQISASCADPKDKPQTDYSIFVGKLNDQLSHIVKDAEKGNTHADFTNAGYSKTQNGNAYFVTRIYGTFTDDKDVDWFRFLPPTDLDVSKTRLTAMFDAHPHGKAGSGATNPAGWAAVSLADAPTAVIAKVNFANKGSDIWVPVQGGKPHLLSIKHPGTGAGSNDFYFVSHQVRGDNPLEKASATNDDPKTPEKLDQQQTTGGLPGWFVAGEITEAGKDVDHYELTIPAGYETGKITAFCSAQRAGSGLRSMTIRLLKSDASEISGAKWVEDETTDASIKDIPVNNEAKMLLKVEAKTQAADVSSKYYRCGVVVQK